MRSHHCSKIRKLRELSIVICLLLAVVVPGWAETIDTKVGKLEFQSGYPTKETVQKLYDELDFQRAVQLYLWSNMMASYGAIRDSLVTLGIDSFGAALFQESANPKHLLLTANNDTVYLSGAMDLRDGPIVMEIPSGLVGPINNIWQQAISEVGGPFGPDQNRGGRFLIVPPNYTGKLPETAYHVVKSDTNTVLWYLRGIPKTRDDFKKLADHASTIRIYPLSEAANLPGGLDMFRCTRIPLPGS